MNDMDVLKCLQNRLFEIPKRRFTLWPPLWGDPKTSFSMQDVSCTVNPRKYLRIHCKDEMVSSSHLKFCKLAPETINVQDTCFWIQLQRLKKHPSSLPGKNDRNSLTKDLEEDKVWSEKDTQGICQRGGGGPRIVVRVYSDPEWQQGRDLDCAVEKVSARGGSPALVGRGCSDSLTGCSAATDLTDSRESVGAEVVKQGGYDLRVENLTTLEFRKKRGQKTDPKTRQKVNKNKLENDVSSNK